jgi:hypothetical protein
LEALTDCGPGAEVLRRLEEKAGLYRLPPGKELPWRNERGWAKWKAAQKKK